MKQKFIGLLMLAWILPMFSQPRVRASMTASVPTIDEEKGLYHMREEEKLARDVYVALAAQWNLQIFANISVREQNHFDQIAALLDRYKLADPGFGEPGEFSDSHLQELYTTLVARGSVPPLEARAPASIGTSGMPGTIMAIRLAVVCVFVTSALVWLQQCIDFC